MVAHLLFCVLGTFLAFLMGWRSGRRDTNDYRWSKRPQDKLMLPRTKAEIDERYIVVEEMFMTNPPKHAGWALMDSTTRAVIATSVSENALDKAAEILNQCK